MALGALLPELSPAERPPLIDLVAHWAAVKPDDPAYIYVDYTQSPDGVRLTLSWAETYRRARATAAALRRAAAPGDRAVLLLPQGMEYITAMLGAMYARVVAVPLFSPDQPGYADRLIGAYTDAEPAVVVTSEAALQQVEKFLANNDVPPPGEILLAEDIDPGLADGWRDEPIGLGEVAYLQYTSGSTRRPAGVQITHGNFEANTRQLWARWAPEPNPAMVTWLPLFHDMGLISTLALPLVAGDCSTFTSPMSFLMNPWRWLELLSGMENTYTAGPNFAYEYVASLATPDKLAGISLHGLVSCLNGAEPIKPGTLAAFAETFEPVGLRPGAQAPGYGLAEATVFVSAAAGGEPPRVLNVDRVALGRGELRPCAEGPHATSVVSCGQPVGQLVAIVDPETCREVPDGRVGEIWVHGPNVSPGYWRDGERSQETFAGTLAEPGDLPAGPWLRTGDYGVGYGGELYVTGRIKDLIIVDGRNHYPQDVELTVQEAHPAVRPGFVAAFAVPGRETERLVVVAERNRRVPLRQLDVDEVAGAARAAISVKHEMSLHELVLVEPGAVSRTSSGKVARAATRERYLAGTLPTTRARLEAP